MPAVPVMVVSLVERSRALRDDGERGDVPGWVMVTVMTAILVVAILAAFRQPIIDAVTNALSSVTHSR
jgi:hypothetical protein